MERAIFTMVCQRCLEPASKLEATRWVGRDVVIDGVDGVSDDQLYRAMDFLLACAERVQESVFFSVAHLLNLEVDVIFFDTTSTYFETEPAHDVDDDEEDAEDLAGEQAGPLRRQGHSKDHRPDLPQVVIGLAVTREGIPVRCWVWPGNTNDQSVVAEEDTGEARRAVAQLAEDGRADQAPETVSWDFAEQLAQPRAIKTEVHQPGGDVDEVRLPHELDLQAHCHPRPRRVVLLAGIHAALQPLGRPADRLQHLGG